MTIKKSVHVQPSLRPSTSQREGVAKVTDNLATACLIAGIIGGLVDHKVDLQVFASLLGLFAVLLSIGLNLRKQRS